MRFIIGLLTFVFLSSAAIAQNYVLKPGDVLNIEVVEDSSLNRSVLVLPDGTITFPFAGTLNAAGRSVAQVQSSLRTALAPNFAATPTVFASINQISSDQRAADAITIYVVGEVNSPGPKEIEAGMTFLQALSATGGFTPFAAKRRIQLRRTDPSTGNEHIYKFDFRAVGNGALISGNSTLRDGDVILVPERRLFE
ncbi:MAG: polysaccharide biosynthesis/export family protein [Qingshengfaniella sp.]